VAEPGISTYSVRAVLLEAEERSLACESLLKRNALSRERVSDPDGWVPLRSYAGFYRDAVAASRDPGAFWVGVGGRALVQAARVTGHAAAASSTVREALETWARLSGLVVDLVRYHVESTSRADRFFGTWPLAQAALFADIQVSALLAFRRFVDYVASVHWGAEWPCLAYPPGTFGRPVHLADPKLLAVLVETATRRLASETVAP
jgi:hypothetical protein